MHEYTILGHYATGTTCQQSNQRESHYHFIDITMHQQWEYKTLEPPKGLTKRETVDPTEELNRLGTEGWELVETISYDGGGTKLLLFKRPVSHE